MPTEIDQIEREIMQREMERQALKNEKDEASRRRLERLGKELSDLREKSAQLKAQWQNEKKGIDESPKLQKQIKNLQMEFEQAQRRGDLTKTSEIQYGRL